MRKQSIDERYINDFNNGMTLWQISEKYGDTYKNAYEKIFNHRFESRLLPDIEKDMICELYNSKISSVKIGKMYGIDHHAITAVLDERGISRDQASMVRKYALDEHYFDEIDTQIKGYIFGFLLSDGYNNPKKQTISLSLQEEDRDILERIRTEVGSEKPLEYLDYSNKHDFGYTYKNQYRLMFFSSKMCSSLVKHGLVPNKSLVIEFPNFDDSIMPSLIRGMWDGDGSLGLYGNNISVSLTATKMFCEGLQKYLKEKIDVDCKIYDAPCHNGVTKSLYISKNAHKIKFLEWMYKDSTIHLDRKYQKYLQILSYYYSKHGNSVSE